jgi:hypothetical protein
MHFRNSWIWIIDPFDYNICICILYCGAGRASVLHTTTTFLPQIKTLPILLSVHYNIFYTHVIHFVCITVYTAHILLIWSTCRFSRVFDLHTYNNIIPSHVFIVLVEITGSTSTNPYEWNEENAKGRSIARHYFTANI